MRKTLFILLLPMCVLVGAQEDAGIPQRLAWLRENIGDTRSVSVAENAISLSAGKADLDRIRSTLEEIIGQDPSLAPVLVNLASIYRTARDLATAARLYYLAYEAGGESDLNALLNYAQVQFELGNVDQADSASRKALLETNDYTEKRRAYTMLARCFHYRDESEEAERMLMTLAALAPEQEGPSDSVEAESLILLYEVQIALDKAGAAQETRLLIERLFPESLAIALVNHTPNTISPPALPGTMALSDTVIDLPMSDASTSPLRRVQPQLSAIQVGSFGDPDNASHMADDLGDLGLTARVEEVSREGSTLYQVIVEIAGGSPERATQILTILTENGFDGFLVY